MPNIFVRVPADMFDRQALSQLALNLNATAARVEQMPDDPQKRYLNWIVIDQVAGGLFTCGGHDMTAQVTPVIVVVHVPQGVLDDASRAAYVAGVHQAVTEALAKDRRLIHTSCILNEVADGHWGANGALWHLQDFAAAAGYAHLQHLVDHASPGT